MYFPVEYFYHFPSTALAVASIHAPQIMKPNTTVGDDFDFNGLITVLS